MNVLCVCAGCTSAISCAACTCAMSSGRNSRKATSTVRLVLESHNHAHGSELLTSTCGCGGCADDCPRRPLVCDYQCGETLEAQHLADHKEKLCVKRPMPPTPCRLGCGVIFSSSMDRYDVIMEIMEEHEREMCPHRIVTCDFDGYVGCFRASREVDHVAAWGWAVGSTVLHAIGVPRK